jgi:succinoglycan biosynthesis transport protein ExoP
MKGTAEGRVEAMGQVASGRAGAAGDIDVVHLWSALKRNSRWIILPTLFALALSIAGVNMVEPRYTAEARLLLQSGDNYYTRPGASPDRDPGIDERDVMSQVQVISSRDLAREAIARLGLKGNPDFDPNMRPQPWRRVLELLGLAHPVGEERAQEKLIEEYRDRVVAFPVLQSRVLVVEFTSRNPELSARGANLVAQLFLDAQAQAKVETAKSASGWLKETIEPLRARLAEAEAKAEAFRARTGLLVGANNATLVQQQMADVNLQLTTARSAQADAQARANLIREALKGARPLESSDVANNDLVRRLTADQAALRAQIALESRSLLPGHPRIKELTAPLTQVDAQIRAAAEKAARTLRTTPWSRRPAWTACPPHSRR